MAYVKFKKPDELSTKKNYVPNSVKYKKQLWIWKLTTILEAFFIIYLIVKLKG